VKIERLSSRSPQLIYESKVLKQIQGGSGIPILKWAGIEGNHTMMILELLGPNIEDLFNMCSRKFSLKTVLMVADQLLTRIEYIHSKSFIHRDIKPENFLVGLGGKSSLIYIIDFGLSKKFRDPKTLKHIEYKEGKHLTGTARYASINTHAGIEPSRRDDLQSIAYVLLYLLKGALPWQGMNASSRLEKYKFIMDKKVAVSDEELCRGLPNEFKEFLQYSKQLGFDDCPDYEMSRRSFRELMNRNEMMMDLTYDWLPYTTPHKKVKSCMTEEKKTDSLRERRNKSGQIFFDKSHKKNCLVF
jgi:serine/threonine protein kinase